MAALTLKLRARAKCTIHSNRTFVHLFSSSSSPNSSNGGDDGQDPPPSQSPPPPSSASHFNDVKASLKQPPPPNPRRLFQSPPPNPPSFSQSNATKFRSLEEIRKNLSQFRSTTAPQPVSFQEIYKRNVLGKGGEGVGSGEPTKIASFDKIRESLMNLRITQNPNQNDRSRGGADGMNNKVMDPLSLKSFKESLQMKPDSKFVRSSPVETAPPASFGKDLKGKAQPSKNYLLRAYKYEELGERLRKLRPTDAKIGKNWFSLSELNERLQKLREIEEKESVSSIGGVTFADLRSSLSTLQHDADEKTKRSSLQRLDMLSHLGGTPSYMLSPPKEQLVEKFFHPDNMSSAEKLKLELLKVRDEFKMSESDCGSSRVQVAQLTTKIKHLSSVLHKKDKHSRKGLQEMVQRRKKLLRYLRRTDWDSYCLCLSKLGLRDNPDYKN